MKKKYLSIPGFFVDSLPDISYTNCRELLRCIEIRAGASNIYVWLKQLRIAPYSYDFLDNRGRKSPGYIIENLPPLKINAHFLLAFHIFGFEENTFIAGRFCVPINPPVNRYMKDMFIEYRIQELGTNTRLWCKVKGWFNNDIASNGFFNIFSGVNKIMTRRQLRKIKKLSEMLAVGKIKNGIYDLNNYYFESGLLWWVFCRRNNCKGLIT
jgi:hypothetical protein